MRLAATAIIAACLVGAAVAQEPPLVFIPEFDAQPSPTELVRHYPPQALRDNVSGIVILCCTPRPDRSVSCDVSSETPAAHGFGAASVAASASYRLTQQSHSDLEARPGTRVRISMLWAAASIHPRTIDELRRIDGETMEACLPPL